MRSKLYEELGGKKTLGRRSGIYEGPGMGKSREYLRVTIAGKRCNKRLKRNKMM